jgi:hypothetical protein
MGRTRSRRVGMAAVVLAMVLGVGLVVRAAAPHTFATGEVVAAADLNALQTQITALQSQVQSIPKITDWASYSPNPVLTAGTLTATATGFWRRVGGSVEVNLYTSITGCTGAGQIQWSPPPNVAPDINKLPFRFAHIGNALVFTGGAVSTTSVATADATTTSAVALEGTNCASFSNGAGDVRMTFSFPVVGWTATGP